MFSQNAPLGRAAFSSTEAGTVTWYKCTGVSTGYYRVKINMQPKSDIEWYFVIPDEGKPKILKRTKYQRFTGALGPSFTLDGKLEQKIVVIEKDVSKLEKLEAGSTSFAIVLVSGSRSDKLSRFNWKVSPVTKGDILITEEVISMVNNKVEFTTVTTYSPGVNLIVSHVTKDATGKPYLSCGLVSDG